MPTTFRPCAPDQSLLFPPSPRDWLPEGHLAFFVADTVAAVVSGAIGHCSGLPYNTIGPQAANDCVKVDNGVDGGVISATSSPGLTVPGLITEA